MLSELEYAAFLAYSPHGQKDAQPHRSSLRLRDAVKNDGIYRGEPVLELAVRRLCELRPREITTFFGRGVTVVPAPRSAPFPRNLRIPLRGSEKEFLWVPRRICQILAGAGLADAWEPLLERTSKVERSSTAAAGERALPKVHFESLACQHQRLMTSRLLVVDDFVTRGATLLGCASRLREVYPEAEIRGFALVRTVSNPAEFRDLVEPVAGTIWLRPGGDTLRRP